MPTQYMPNNAMKNTSENNIMVLNGTGQVTAVPDIAVLRLGVQTNDINLETAQTENARLSQAVLQALQQMDVSDIKTYQYTISKLYDYENGNQIDRGYQVRNILEIRTDAMNQVGAIIDAAVDAGANVVDFIDFEVSDSDDYYLEALNLAVANAMMKAKSITENLRIRLDPIPRKINENSATPIPYRNFAMREGIATTPIEPGNKQIEASVTVEFLFG